MSRPAPDRTDSQHHDHLRLQVGFLQSIPDTFCLLLTQEALNLLAILALATE